MRRKQENIINDNNTDTYQSVLFPEKHEKVFMDNQLARAEWHTSSVITERALAEVISQIKNNDEKLKASYKIPASALFSDPGGKDYKRLEKAAISLTKEVVVVYNDYTHETGTVYSIFRRSSFNNQTEELSVSINPDIKPFILALKGCFTVYNKLDFILLPSRYSQRLFKLLKSWEGVPQTQIALSDLHKILITPISCQKNFAEFDRRILSPAHEHITKNTDLIYEYEPFKIGRKIHSVIFKYKSKRKIKRTRTANKSKTTQNKNSPE